MLFKALNAEKTAARAELKSIAYALESFRRERGSYPESKSEAALIDNLNPHYLARVIASILAPALRVRGHGYLIRLTFGGPDEKVNTADDVVLSRWRLCCEL